MTRQLLEQYGDHEETSELCCWFGQEAFLARHQTKYQSRVWSHIDEGLLKSLKFLPRSS